MRLKQLAGLIRTNRRIPREITRIRARAYPFTPAPRPYAGSRAGALLLQRLELGRSAYASICNEIVSDRDAFATVSAGPQNPAEPYWVNGFIPPLDGMSLYTLVRLLKPATYLEIGSGNSTKFVRKAIRDGGLPTRIISIDPTPRAEIDPLCDRVVRASFQDVAADALGWIAPGDVVFQDGSHLAFTNTDTTVFFTEFLPLLPRGVTYGIHDIFLPDDYPAEWHRRLYNEQYLLLAWLLGGSAGDETIFPVQFVSQDQALSSLLAPVFDLPALAGRKPHGGAFWMRRP